MKFWQKCLVTLGVIAGIAGTASVASALTSNRAQDKYRENASRTLHVKLVDDTAVTVADNQFTGGDPAAAERLNKTLANKQVTRSEKVFQRSKAELDWKRASLQPRSPRKLANLNNYYTFKFTSEAERDHALALLKADPLVQEAYPEPEPVKAPTADYRGQQHYANASPEGVGFKTPYTASVPGSDGSNVRLFNIEYSWNALHEDLTGARAGTRIIVNGAPLDPFNDKNHGTATMGILDADRNGFGIDGLVPKAELGFINAATADSWAVAQAVYLATDQMEAGDVMLLEQQTTGPNGVLVPAEWYGPVYDAIVYAVSKGVIVIESAGNGNQNLDSGIFGSNFPMGKPHSGAIMVGAGEHCNAATARSRANFGEASSNYGQRVDVQGPGNCIMTTGYGDYAGSGNSSYSYGRYGGTSAASAIVATVAASVSSAYEQRYDKPITPDQLRILLKTTGVAQNTTNGLGGLIGPMPNLEAALRTFAASPQPEQPEPEQPKPEQEQPYGLPDQAFTYGKTGPSGAYRLKLANATSTAIGNLTVHSTEGIGFFATYPCAEGWQGTSNLNYNTGETVAVGIFAKTDAQGYLCFYSPINAHFIWDQVAVTPLQLTSTPARLYDSRNTGAKQPGGAPKAIRAGAPGQAIIGTVTVTFPEGGFGFAAIYPCADGWRGTSNLNYLTNQTVANSFVSKADANGDICFYSSNTTHFIIDRAGATNEISVQPPHRVYDSRTTGAKVAGGTEARFRAGAPNATVVGNLTAVNTEYYGYLTVYPCAQGRPSPMTSSLNFVSGQTVANMVVAKTDANGDLCVYTTTNTDVIWDAMGSIPGVKANAPQRIYDSRGL